MLDSRLVVFDLEGTLIDTREAVKAAYRIAGVDMPDHAWGLSWREWGVTEDQHDIKNKAYPSCLHLARALPLLDVALLLRAPVITSASFIAVNALCKHFVVGRIVGCELTREQKVVLLARMSPLGGVYVDDCARTRELVKERIKWETWTPEDAYLRLSSRPEPTLD